MRGQSPLLSFLGASRPVEDLDAEEWSMLFAEARTAGILSRVTAMLDAQGIPERMPKRFLNHVSAGRYQGRVIVRDTLRELRFLREALANLRTPLILLKGAAYVAADLPPAVGRVFSDVDLLVDRAFVARAESALMLNGWTTGKIDPYDQRYYREWSHEIPPLTHIHRGTTVDLHHSLVMPTCRLRVNSALMVESAVPIHGMPGWHRLANEDLVLHACAHLLLNSEFDRGLRDLGDVDLMIRHFTAEDPAFGSRVLSRARVVGLEDIAERAFDLCRRFYATPIPCACERRRSPDFVSKLLAASATTRHPDTRPTMQPITDALLALRELSLRFPPTILVRHLAHKVVTGFSSQATSA